MRHANVSGWPLSSWHNRRYSRYSIMASVRASQRRCFHVSWKTLRLFCVFHLRSARLFSFFIRWSADRESRMRLDRVSPRRFIRYELTVILVQGYAALRALLVICSNQIEKQCISKYSIFHTIHRMTRNQTPKKIEAMDDYLYVFMCGQLPIGSQTNQALEIYNDC